ncbi:helix-turn-helix domain-containing protein [Cohnella suwonensis]|uniref:Helix-turn-helix domain-containing protein n=1 Tax=Cohnella suwonensis TaxID=696072 RepID=A0ABW0LQ33_9BACL
MNRNWFRKLLLSYLPVFFVVITALFVIFFQTLSEQNRKEAIKANEYLAQQVIRYTDNELRKIDYRVVREILADPVVSRFFSLNDIDVYENIQAGKIMEDLKFNYPIVHSVYFVRLKDHYVFGDGSVWREDFPDMPFIEQMKGKKDTVKWTGKRVYQLYPSLKGEEVISLVRGYPYFTSAKKGYFVVNVSLSKLKESVAQMYNPDISFVRMYDNRHRSLLDKDDETSGEGKVFSEFVSPYTGWLVESGLIDTGFLRIALNFYSVWLGLAIAAVLLGVFWVVHVTKRNYQPIGQIVSLIQTSSLVQPNDGKSDGNEFGFIRGALEHLMEETKKIRQENVENSILQKKHRFLEAMEGTVPITEAEWSSDLRKYNVDAAGKIAYVQVLEIDGYRAFSQTYDQQDQSLFKFLLSSILQEMTQQREASIWAEWTTDRQMAAIIWVPEKEKLDEMRDAITALVIQWVKQNLSFTITLGHGGAAATLEELRRSYETACSLLSYKAVLGTGRVIHPEEIARPQTRNHEYFHTIYSFSNALRLPDQDWNKQLAELFKQIRDSIFSRKEIESLLSFLHQHLDRVFLELSREYRNVWKETETELLEAEKHWETIEELQSSCIRIFEAASGKMQSLRDSHRNRIIIGEIRSFIEEHYANPELSLDYLSDKFLMNAKNISKMFKEEFGENFVDFLIGLRIQNAKKRLMETEKSLQEISVEVGYYNYNSFNRAFKNIAGVSPSDYRKQTGH